jgi:hypothetical protein
MLLNATRAITLRKTAKARAIEVKPEIEISGSGQGKGYGMGRRLPQNKTGPSLKKSRS